MNEEFQKFKFKKNPVRKTLKLRSLMSVEELEKPYLKLACFNPALPSLNISQ